MTALDLGAIAGAAFALGASIGNRPPGHRLNHRGPFNLSQNPGFIEHQALGAASDGLPLHPKGDRQRGGELFNGTYRSAKFSINSPMPIAELTALNAEIHDDMYRERRTPGARLARGERREAENVGSTVGSRKPAIALPAMILGPWGAVNPRPGASALALDQFRLNGPWVRYNLLQHDLLQPLQLP